MLKRLLIIAPFGNKSAPRQEIIIKNHFIAHGYKVQSLTDKDSGFKRLFDIIINGLFLIKKNDVILINIFGGKAFIHESISILYSRFFNKKIVAVLRGGYIPYYYDKYKRFYKFILNMVDKIIVPSDYLFHELSSRGHVIDQIIPNFIEIDKYDFRLRKDIKPKILYTRGIHGIYNPLMAIDAFSLIQAKYSSASLTIAGNIADLKLLQLIKNKIKELDLKNISIIGFIEKDKISSLIHDHDIYIQTNIVENMPVSILEMWACGIPIIATGVGGITSLCNNEIDSIIINSEDYVSMSQQCIRLINNNALTEKLSYNGKQKVKEYAWENVSRKWDDVLFND